MRIQRIKIYQAVIFTILAQGSLNAKAQNPIDREFEREEVRIYMEKTDTSKISSLIKRSNCNAIVFSFFEQFNDTVVLFINNKKHGQWYIDAKNNPVESSGYSGIDYSLILKKKKNKVLIKLLNQRKYVEFEVTKKYPLYTVQRYGNIWYINVRKYTMILK